MGARVYVPSIGRFLQVDPIEGGTDNNYVYPGDPVNDFDLDGTFSLKKMVKDSWKWVGKNSDKIGMGVAAVGFGVCVVATAGACGVAAVVGAGVSASLSVAKSRAQGSSWSHSLAAGVVSGATDVAIGKIKFGKTVLRQAGTRVWGGRATALSYDGVKRALATNTGKERLAKFTINKLGGYYAGNLTQWGYNKAVNKYKNWRGR